MRGPKRLVPQFVLFCEDIPDGVLQGDLPFPDHHSPVSILGDDPHGVGDDDDRGARLVKVPDQVHHAALLGVIQARGRLVQDQDLWTHGEHARHSDALTLALGESERVFIPTPLHSHCGEGFSDPLLYLSLLHIPYLRPERHLVEDGVREDLVVRVLEDVSDGLAEPAQPLLRGLLPIHQNRALGGLQQPVEMLDQRGLARSVLAENGQKLATPDGEIYPLECDYPVRVAVRQPLDFDHGLSVTFLPLLVCFRHLRRLNSATPSSGVKGNCPCQSPFSWKKRVTCSGMTLDSSRRSTSLRTSLAGLSATILPFRKTIMRSASRVSSVSCSTTMRVTSSRSLRSSAISKMPSFPMGSRSVVGSSRHRMRGSMASTEAMARRCFWPPERVAGVRFSKPSRRTCPSTLSTRLTISSRSTAKFSGPKATSRATFVEKSWASKSWKTSPTSWANSPTLPSRVERPPTRTSPSILPLKKWGIRPFKETHKVLFPAPDGPITTTNSPSATSRSIPWSAGFCCPL